MGTDDNTEISTADILISSRTELSVYMRYLNLALSALRFEEKEGIQLLGTDGNTLFFSPSLLLEEYKAGRIWVNRAYLHQILHCIYRHPFRPYGNNKRLWDISCDIAMEYIIDSFRYHCVRMSGTRYRRIFYENLKGKIKIPTAQAIYKLLEPLDMSDKEYEQLEFEFRKDDHSFWAEEEKREVPLPDSAEQKWQDISEKTQTELETQAQDVSDEVEGFLEQLEVENRKKHDYRSFLRKFSIMKEEAVLDMDSYDLSFYTYGLSLYGNMPLIEYQESRESRRIEDFVIAVDTSMSCSGELVQEFLMQTYKVLKESESFFKRTNIHILQCDETIQSDEVIHSEEELEVYMQQLQLKGGGGTDFRPVFAYVGKLMEEKAFHHLKGLLYFTDGKGIYPRKRPPYDTAFVFLKEDYTDADVPPWAMKLILNPEDLNMTKGELE
jgi:predicted metal-dependent peptidase